MNHLLQMRARLAIGSLSLIGVVAAIVVAATMSSPTPTYADDPPENCGPGYHSHDQRGCHIISQPEPTQAPTVTSAPAPKPIMADGEYMVELPRECKTIQITVGDQMTAAISGAVDGAVAFDKDDLVDLRRTADMTVCTEGYIKATVGGTITVR